MKRIFLSVAMLLVGCSSAASQDQSAKDTTEDHFINPIFVHSAVMKPGPILPTNCVNMFLLILLLALMLFRISRNKN